MTGTTDRVFSFNHSFVFVTNRTIFVPFLGMVAVEDLSTVVP